MDSAEMMICNWRVTRGIPSGLHIWFDPAVESVCLYRVPTREQQSFGPVPEGALDAGVGPGYLDKVGSVSELEGEGDNSIDEQSDPPFVQEDLPF